MNITRKIVDGITEIGIEVTEEAIGWFEELFSHDDAKSFFWADKGVVLWFTKLEEEE